ncbi:SARP family transcriptional regulator [Paractinoplanes rishiriensis]|uniref:SARP family transcriptional regulator n=1 Tax=Paractinoplanes rishiriensis TaxID=1050105 RepID=A0A919JXE5_9ACTN|nr:SARP family transcriptional regulator [Actinoplanes rishiriensis]
MLGPTEVWANGRRVDAGQPQQRAVLAGLLADAGRSVPVDTLIDRVWGQDPPRGARPSLQAHITRIRQMLEQAGEPGRPPVPLVFAAGCYLLDVDPGQVDLHRFRLLAAQARAPQCPDELRVDLLRQAVELWRGEPLAGLRGPWMAQSRLAWQREYLAAAVDWGDAELKVGNPGAAITLLSDLTAEHPLTESLAVVLMRALAAAGRPAEALTHYESIRQHLVAELGTDPSAELQAAYRSILQGTEPAAEPRPAEAAPAQLPADVSGFTGRTEHLDQLDARLRETSTVAIVTVAGMAGVGKTALALHWAHRVADQFPDGQLYVNLRGFDPAGRVMDPADAVRGFLDALGVAPGRIPATLDGQAALYRSQLAGKRILVVLDNARDAEQVRPLLPATAGAVAVVTSRNQLTALLAVEGARPVPLDVLPEEEARDLLRRRLGADRTDAEPGAVADIIAACARLPIALAITAARALQNSFPLAALAAELHETGARLDALDTGDPGAQVRAVFACSYAALSPATARLFRLLGLHPGPDVSVAAAAALAGLPTAPARRLLAELTHANLLLERAPGRYVCHDLLRTYAADLTETHDPDAVRRAATVRLLDHYAHSAYAADRVLYPVREPIEIPLGDPAADSHPFADHRAAMDWLTAEHPVLLAAAKHAADNGFDTYAWQLAWAIDTFLFRRGHWYDRVAIWSNAERSADRLDNLNARALAYREVARSNIDIGRPAEARPHLHRALELCVQSGNRAGQANVHNNLAYLNAREQDYQQALAHTREALALYEAAGNLRGQAIALSGLGWYNDMLGEYEEAIVYCRQALELQAQVGDRRGEADVWDSLGYAHHHLGRYAEAAECYEHALEVVREIGDRHAEAEILVHLGDTHQASGHPNDARTAWTAAVTILGELEHTDVDEITAKLAALPAEPAMRLPSQL